MGTWIWLRRLSLPTLALSGVFLAGCNNLNHGPANQTAVLEDNSAPVRVTAHEAANVEVALGRTLENRGANEKAMTAYKEAIHRDPHCAEAYVRLGILYDLQGNGKQSYKCYRQALKERPGDPDIFCNMGYSFYLQRRWAEAEMNLRQAIALKSEHQRAHTNLGLVLARTERLDEALVEFRTAKCSVADAHVNVAFALALDGKLPEARRYYQLALAADPGCETAKSGLNEVQTLMARVTKPERRPPATAIAATPPIPMESPATNSIRLTSASAPASTTATLSFGADD